MSAAVTLSARQDGDASGQEGEREYRGLLPKRGRTSLLDFLNGVALCILPFLGPRARVAHNLLSYHWGFHLSPILTDMLPEPRFRVHSF